MVLAAAWGHHLRHDGGGYPREVNRVIVSRSTALLHLCDVFEALTAIRPYKRPLSPLLAWQIILKDRKSFDPAALQAFVTAIGFYPPGSRVRLSSGEEGLVVAAGSDPARPRLRLTRRKDGEAVTSEEEVVDLGTAAAAGLSVAEAIQDDQLEPATT